MKLTENKLVWQTKRNYEYQNENSDIILLVVSTETEFPQEVDLSVMKNELFMCQSETEFLSLEEVSKQLVGATHVFNDLVFDFPEIRAIMANKKFEVRENVKGFEKVFLINNEFVLGMNFSEDKKSIHFKRKVRMEISDLFLIVRQIKSVLRKE